jgi:hypothetical protein
MVVAIGIILLLATIVIGAQTREDIVMGVFSSAGEVVHVLIGILTNSSVQR